MRARRMIGQGAILDGIFNNLALDGVLQLQGQTLTSNKMTLRATKLRSQLVILADLATGRFNAALVGDIKGLLIPGIGIVDVRSDIRAVPRKGGGLALTGKARADVRRFDNGFLRGLRSEEHTSEIQSLMRISYAVF